jgi:hypothetical protein
LLAASIRIAQFWARGGLTPLVDRGRVFLRHRGAHGRFSLPIFYEEFAMKNPPTTSSNFLTSRNKQLQDILVIRTGQKITGRIAASLNQVPILEGQIYMAKWSTGTAFAVYCAKVIEMVNKLDQQSVVCSQRLAQIGMNELEAQIVLQTDARQIDAVQTRSAVVLLSKKVAAQCSLLEPPITIDDPKIEEFIDEQAEIFLQARGGQPLAKQIELVMNGDSVGVVSGAWAAQAKDQAIKSRIFDVNCFFDGRRLRSRTLFLVEANATGKKHYVTYDESKFDALIRSFQDNKDTALVATIEELTRGSGEISFILAKLELAKNLQDFKLEGESTRSS